MTTLKDKIRDAVIVYHVDFKKDDIAADPETLVETIVEIINEEINDYFNRQLN